MPDIDAATAFRRYCPLMDAMNAPSGRSADAAGAGSLSNEEAAEADAIRYLILTKLAPGLRHAMVGRLHAIQGLAEVGTRMLRRDPDIPKVAEKIARIGEQCGAAAKVYDSVLEWLRPDPSQTTSVGDCIRQCLRLAGEEWSLRGIEVSTDIDAGDGVHVTKWPARELVVAALLVLTDQNDGSDLTVEVRCDTDEVAICIARQPSMRVVSHTSAPRRSRSLTCADLACLGKVHGIPTMCESGVIRLRLPQVGPPAAPESPERHP